MKHILLLLFCIQTLFAFAGGSIKLVSATTRHWVSGAPGGRQGETQSITVRICSKNGVVFQQLWLGDKEFNFQLESGKPDSKMAPGDTLTLSHSCATGEADCIGKENTLPLNYKGAALLQYTVKGKKRYLIIKKFTRVEDSRGY